MTDAEINLAIAKLEYPDYKIESWISSAVVTPLRHPNIRGIDYREWCWIGPIIEREKIDLHYEPMTDGKDWHAASCGNIAEVWADTPTKAAALCYLRMKGVEL